MIYVSCRDCSNGVAVIAIRNQSEDPLATLYPYSTIALNDEGLFLTWRCVCHRRHDKPIHNSLQSVYRRPTPCI
jgi:hypothetical protein